MHGKRQIEPIGCVASIGADSTNASPVTGQVPFLMHASLACTDLQYIKLFHQLLRVVKMLEDSQHFQGTISDVAVFFRVVQNPSVSHRKSFPAEAIGRAMESSSIDYFLFCNSKRASLLIEAGKISTCPHSHERTFFILCLFQICRRPDAKTIPQKPQQ